MNLPCVRVGRREKSKCFGAWSNDIFARQCYKQDSVKTVRE